MSDEEGVPPGEAEPDGPAATEGAAAAADGAEPAPPGGPSRTVLVVVGLLVGLLVGAALGWATSRDDEGDDGGGAATATSTTAPETAEAAAALVAAWERSRTATFLTGSLLERTNSTGMVVEIPLVVAQRPPDRVISTGSSVSGVVGGEVWVCDEQLDGILHCGASGAAVDPASDLAAELDVLRSYFAGDLPLYRVSQTGECFDLRLARAVQAPPYGQRARFCFDPVSGAPSLQRVERAEGTDVVTLLSARTDVTDDDIARVAAGDVDEGLLAG